jgi:hypothetical protein
VLGPVEPALRDGRVELKGTPADDDRLGFVCERGRKALVAEMAPRETTSLTTSMVSGSPASLMGQSPASSAVVASVSVARATLAPTSRQRNRRRRAAAFGLNFGLGGDRPSTDSQGNIWSR